MKPKLKNTNILKLSSTPLDAKILELKKIPGLYEFVLENCFIAGGAVRDVFRGLLLKTMTYSSVTKKVKIIL